MKPSRTLTLAVTLILAATACGDSTATRQTVVVVSLARLLGPTVTSEPDGGQSVSCEIELTAQAGGAGVATWLDATLRASPVGSPASVQTTVVTADIVRQVWGADQIAAGETQTSRWIAIQSFPFFASVDFRYRASPGGPILGSGISFTCSP